MSDDQNRLTDALEIIIAQKHGFVAAIARRESLRVRSVFDPFEMTASEQYWMDMINSQIADIQKQRRDIYERRLRLARKD